MPTDPISSAKDGKGSDNGNENVEDYDSGKGEVLHREEGPGHFWALVDEGGETDCAYKLDGPPMGSHVMFPMVSSLKSSQMGYPV